MRKVLGASLGLSVALSSFLCLGMGMEMGWAAPAHKCCPAQAPAKDGGDCCLLLPAAASAAFAAPAPVQFAFILPDAPVSAGTDGRRLGTFPTGPPGLAPSNAAPAAPRAPPAA